MSEQKNQLPTLDELLERQGEKQISTDSPSVILVTFEEYVADQVASLSTNLLKPYVRLVPENWEEDKSLAIFVKKLAGHYPASRIYILYHGTKNIAMRVCSLLGDVINLCFLPINSIAAKSLINELTEELSKSDDDEEDILMKVP